MIDWLKVQGRINALQDGKPGRETYGKLIKVVAPTLADIGLERVAQAMAKYCPRYGQDETPDRLADFIAQTCNETGGYRRFEENLNYSARALANTWPNRYAGPDGNPNAKALALANRPEAIANATYGLRMGNLPTVNDTDEHPDGWQYRGRGALQLTGRANYERYGKLVGLDLVNMPELAADPAISILIALEFYRQGKVNDALDRGAITTARAITNGGSVGLAHVNNLRKKLLQVLE